MNTPNRNPARKWLPDELHLLAVDRLACPWCPAIPRQECRTDSGDVARETHWKRVEPIASAYGITRTILGGTP